MEAKGIHWGRMSLVTHGECPKLGPSSPTLSLFLSPCAVILHWGPLHELYRMIHSVDYSQSY